MPPAAQARLYGSAFGVNSGSFRGVAYESFGVTVDANNNAIVFPGHWRVDENGEWGNDFDGTVFECTLGAGVVVFKEALEEIE